MAIKIKFRQNGIVLVREFAGEVRVDGERIPVVELPLKDGVLDLTHVPVVAVGGSKSGPQKRRLEEFRCKAPDFRGVIYLLPYSWANGWSDGQLILSSRDILFGQRLSGGKPETQLTNHRWLRDGRYVADRARMLHGKALETIETAVEQEPGASKIAEALTDGNHSFAHRLLNEAERAANELYELEGRRVILSGEKARYMTAFVRDKLVAKLTEAGVRKVAEIPASLTITAAEVQPELAAQAETLGTIEIPGLGRRRLAGRQNFTIGSCAVVEILVAELMRVTDWPFTAIGIRVPEVQDSFSNDLEYGELRDLLWSQSRGRWPNVLGYFAKRWMEVQRLRNYPQTVPVADPRDSDPSSTPEPVVWGKDLLTGEAKTAYPALYHGVGGRKGRIVDHGWSFSWFDDAAEAAKTEAEARREAGSYITARRLEAELTANAKAGKLPVSVPAAYVAPPTYTPRQILAMAGFAEDQYRVREDVGYWYSAGWSSRRDSDGEWSDSCPPTGCFARKGDDGVWEIGSSGLSHLFEGGSVGNYGRTAFAKSVLDEMGAGDKIASIQARIKSEDEAAAEAYRVSVRSFVKALQEQPVYASLSSDMRSKLHNLAQADWGTPAIDEAELLQEWAKAEVLHARQSSGEVLTNWGGHFRIMGATGNCDYWVIRPDGAFRDPDDIWYRKRYTSEGGKQWRLVGPEELAITWSKAFTAADHEFTVAKLPTGGLTPAQLEAVKRLESEIAERFQGATGMSGKGSPGIGKGWGLVPKPAPKLVTPPADAKPASAEQVTTSLDALKAKFGKKP